MQMMVSTIKKLFCCCILVSAAFVTRELYRCEFLLPSSSLETTLDQLPRDQFPRDQLPRYQLPRDQLPRDQLPRDQLQHDQLPREQLPLVQLPRGQLPREHLPRDQLPRDRDSFLSDWCRLQRSRVDWKGLLGNCRNKMAWKQREVTYINRTDANKSFIARWDIKPKGEFSRFYIQTVTRKGVLKRTGGDSWRVYIRQGPASLAPMVIDQDDGTYEVMFLALESGTYAAQVFLDYTLCDGFRDPPEDWYTRGDIQGHKQEPGMLGYIYDDFIKAPLQGGIPVEFDIKEYSKTNGFFKYIQPLLNGTGQAGLSQLSCDIECSLLWNGFGRWVNNTWKPYIPEDIYNQKHVDSENTKLQTLMIYGDSVGVHYHSLASRRPLCRKMFHKCNKKYMWTYDASWQGNDSKDFNQSIVLEEIKQVFRNLPMRGNRSVFLFNVGIHYPISLNFTTYQLLIDNIAKMLTQETGTEGKEKVLSGQTLSIWRSNTAIETEYLTKFFPQFNFTAEWRFHTNPRSQLFHKYATSAMCMAGTPVLDMYPLTAAWPNGTRDSVHYTDKAIEPAIRVLERYLAEYLLKS